MAKTIVGTWGTYFPSDSRDPEPQKQCWAVFTGKPSGTTRCLASNQEIGSLCSHQPEMLS